MGESDRLGKRSLRPEIPGLNRFRPLPGEENRVPIGPPWPVFPRFPPVGEHFQPEHGPKSSIY